MNRSYCKQSIRISIVTTPGQVRTIDVTHGGAAAEEFTVRSLSIRQRDGARVVQRSLTPMDVMLDFICMGPSDLPGARRKRQNTK